MWLSGWAKRIKVTVSNTNIDSNLTHFPLLLTLGVSVGTGSDDTTCVFDELTSDANRKKIAVTKSDGTTQCYVEIEKWDDANEKAVLWVSKSDLVLSSSAITDLYLYYDSSHADNTIYVGDVGSRTEVWDSNYLAVWHLGESSNPYIDSTSNNNDSVAGTYPTQANAKIGKGQDFEAGANNYIEIPHTIDWDWGDSDVVTWEAWIKPESSSWRAILSDWVHQQDIQSFFWGLENSTNELRLLLFIGQDSPQSYDSNSGITVDGTTWTYVSTVFDNPNNTIKHYIDSALDKTHTDVTPTFDVTTGDKWIGARTSGSYDLFDGVMDELRVSIAERNADWIKATYYAQSDNLVSWGSEENVFIPKIIMF